ncbi:ADP-ribosylglycohydrolase family protein [Bacillus cereus]|uniref:ADP-ribosylglycohydrolase family protein n=1 Tax=Bacillus cereus TaxID=1396 RepID=A0AAW7NGF1_BACCE|nr:ADP-ribosylglycohydrolase family protein [Bacillus cereus]MDN4873002.1 ADP-ribosylglycohydrolase family protein [Bacillus cereus]
MKNDYTYRILGTLNGLAIGDAFGTPAVHYSPREIPEMYGEKITNFITPIRRSGKGKSKWEKYEVTDDTIQTLILANSLIKFNGFSREGFGNELLKIEERYCKPGTGCGRFRVKANPNNIAEGGEGNGSSMRIAPIGICCSVHEVDKLVRLAVDSSTLTHNTMGALGGSVAIASAVSAAIEGYTINEIIEFSLNTLRKFETRYSSKYSCSILKEIKFAIDIGPEKYVEHLILNKYKTDEGEWGFIALESVACVFSLLSLNLSFKESAIKSVNLGGDSDSTTSMLCAILGAINFEDIPHDWLRNVGQKNNLDFKELAINLNNLRVHGLKDDN